MDSVLTLPLPLLPPARLASGPWHITGRLWFADPTLPAHKVHYIKEGRACSSLVLPQTATQDAT